MIKRVLVIGAGTIGQHIALVCARAGFEVSVYDVNPQALYETPMKYATLSQHFGDDPMTLDEVMAALEGIRCEPDAAKMADGAELVIESVPEDLKLKRNVLRQFDHLCPKETIFATNASAILPSQLAAASGRPDRFAALHFGISNFVELMPHPGTSPETMDALREFAKQLGQLTIHLHFEQPGQVLNTVLMPLVFWSVMLAANGVASVEDIDRAWMKTNDASRGPFGVIDGIGIDTCLAVTRAAIRPFRDKQLRRNAAFFESYVSQGRLGLSSLHGFYRYPDPAFKAPGFLKGE